MRVWRNNMYNVTSKFLSQLAEHLANYTNAFGFEPAEETNVKTRVILSLTALGRLIDAAAVVDD